MPVSAVSGCVPDQKWGVRHAGDKFTFTIEEGANGTNNRISVNYDGFIDDVSVGDILLVDGGIQSLMITDKSGKDVHTEVVDGGTMKSRCDFSPGPTTPRMCVPHSVLSAASRSIGQIPLNP